MGGAQAGEVASALAAATLRESRAVDGGEDRIIALVQEANRRVHERAASDASASGMGTTITAALVDRDGTIAVGHVGDSRAYRLRGGTLEQLTDDHSLVAELVRRGELSPAEAEAHPQRSVITRALGTDPDVDVDVFTTSTLPATSTCSAATACARWSTADTIEDILIGGRADLPRRRSALINVANRSGGEDNITVVLFELIDDEEVPAVGEPDERTREYAAADPDDEDTIHPEDRLAAPGHGRHDGRLARPTCTPPWPRGGPRQSPSGGMGTRARARARARARLSPTAPGSGSTSWRSS